MNPSSKPLRKKGVPIVALDPVALKQLREEEQAQGDPEKTAALEKAQAGTLGLILKSLELSQRSQADRLSFEVDPSPQYQAYAGLYRNKSNLTPDHIIKRVIGASGDDLVCQILQARSNILASFGRPRMSRFGVGFEFEEIPGVNIPEDKELQQKINDRMEQAKKIIWNCGRGPAKKEYFQPNFSQYLKMITRDGLAYGRFATEILWAPDAKSGEEQFYGFRPSDAGTIYHITHDKEQDQSTRQKAIQLLQQIKGVKIDSSKYQRDEYKWVQVIDGVPDQAFSSKEMVVYNMYPTTNIEYNGYPLTPIDQCLNAIMTHINITIHNKLYFQHGRAARGMIIFKSDSVDESMIQKIRLQFHQSINAAQNSWRMPVFGVGAEDEIDWQSIDVSGRDAEFQYLMDSNARSILSAFQMSPEELPGYAHLARGTNTQALSESNNEWKLTAARDVGLRPLLSDIQDFLNTHLLPLIDRDLAKTHRIVLAGLEKEDPEKEAARLQTDMNIHMSMNDILQEVEKELLPDELGGKLPLNQLYLQNALTPYLTVGEILENFFGRKGAAQDPRFAYVRDPFWVQYQQVLMQQAQMAMQNAMAQQQMMMQQAMGGQPGAEGEEGGDEEQGGEQQGPPPSDSPPPPGADATQKAEIMVSNLRKRDEWMAKNYIALEKTIESNSRKISKMILKRHQEIVDRHMEQWEKATRAAVKEIADIADGKEPQS